MKKNVAVIGGGAAGAIVAWLLRDKYNVTLFEENNYLGGHVYTHYIDDLQGSVPVDMGVEYFNERVSPNLFNLLQSLGIESYVAPSSFCAHFPIEGQYWSNVQFDSSLHEVMRDEFSRFHLGMSEVMSSGDARYKIMSIAEYLDENNYSTIFIYQALYPMIRIFTGCNVDLHSYPLMFFALSFNANLVSFFSPGYWRKISGGMSRYLQSIATILGGRLKLSTPVDYIKVHDKGAAVGHSEREDIFDIVILSTPAEVALSLLKDVTEKQKEILSHFAYHDIESVVHCDDIYSSKSAVSHYFNYHQFDGVNDFSSLLNAGSITRYINALPSYKNISTPLMVTLDPKVSIDTSKVFKICSWRVSKMQPDDFLYKTRLCEIQGKNNIWFCGVDTSLGGHEGAVVSGMVIAERLGIPYAYKHDILAHIQFKVTKDIMGVKTYQDKLKDTLLNTLFLVAKKCSLHKSLSYKFIKDFIA